MYWNEIIKKPMIEKFIYLNHFNPHIYFTGGTSTTCHFGAHELFPVINFGLQLVEETFETANVVMRSRKSNSQCHRQKKKTNKYKQ
jgi:hypothetical protein